MVTATRADLLLRVTDLSRRARAARAAGLPTDVYMQATRACCDAIDRLRRGDHEQAAAVLDRAEAKLTAALDAADIPDVEYRWTATEPGGTP